MHVTLKEWNFENWKEFKLHKMKLKRNFANFNYSWDVAKFGNSNVNLQKIWNKIAFEIHWKLHQEKVFDSNEKCFALAKRSQGRGGWVSQNNLQVAIFRQISAITVFTRCHLTEN